MRFARGKDGLSGIASWCLPHLVLLLVVLLLMKTVGAAAVRPDGAHRAAHTTYRVIHLGPGQIASYPHINARGQVAFSLLTGGRATGYFHDGARVRDIGSLGGGTAYVNGLNDAGQVAGTSPDAHGIENAFVWSAGGGMLGLRAGTGAERSYGMAINARGVVTGSSGGRPFRWSRASGMEDLGTIAGWQASFSGQVLDDAGLIAGRATSDDEFTRVFAWTRASGPVDIDTLGSVESEPVAIGAGGEVAGNRLASWDDGGERPFLWTRATGMVDLGTGNGVGAWVNAMTPGLHIVGAIGYGDGRQRAMSWTRRGGMRELGTLGGRTSVARGVNARGQVVGFAENGSGAMRAFVWSAAAGMQDLNRMLRYAPPGLVLEHAMAINDSGAIVAASNAGLVLLRPDRGGRSGHTLGPIVAPRSVKVGQQLQASVAFVDGDRIGTRSVDWSWGDGGGAAARKIVEHAGAGSASAAHSYAMPGSYAVTVTLVDREGRSTTVSHEIVVAASDSVKQ